MHLQKTSSSLLFAFALVSAIAAPASLAGTNDYFNTPQILPGAVGSDPDDTPNGAPAKGSRAASGVQSTPAPVNGPGTVPGAGFDNTADEKRMQRKYKSTLKRMKELISKGEAMMKSAPNQNDKTYKKGKILKETGEKHLADMQANSPYNFDALEGDKKSKDSK
jgi:hypothetical protein